MEGDGRVRPLGLMDIKIIRNAFGPQRESFEADLQIIGLERPYRAVFIRAPAISRVGGDVEVLARVGEAWWRPARRICWPWPFILSLRMTQEFTKYS